MYRIAAYIFPFLLVGIEYVLRTALNSDTAEFIGPTLTAAAAALLVPELALKSKMESLSPDLQKELSKRRVSIRDPIDEALSVVCLLILLAFIGLWTWTVVLAEHKDQVTLFSFHRPIVVGFLSYLAAVVVAEIKEAV